MTSLCIFLFMPFDFFCQPAARNQKTALAGAVDFFK
jgi:hypothetical protein